METSINYGSYDNPEITKKEAGFLKSNCSVAEVIEKE